MSLLPVPIATVCGTFTAYFSQHGLARLKFPSHGASSAPPPRRPPERLLERVRRWQRLTARALREALAGKRPSRLPPLDLSARTPFQRRVWAVLRCIPAGQTWTYAQVAAAVGAPRAVRAVGNACGANPVPVLVPCHRVRRSDGGLGGFSSGLNWKRWLLAREALAQDRAGRRPSLGKGRLGLPIQPLRPKPAGG